MRAYETSHPWLTFTVNLSRAPARLWTLLGECSVLGGSAAGIPLMPGDREELDRDYFARGAVSVLSGGVNAMTVEDVKHMLSGTSEVPVSLRYLAQEAGNFVNALTSIGTGPESLVGSELYPGTLKNYNEQVLDRLVLPDTIMPGSYRTNDEQPSGGQMKPAPAEDIEFLVDSLCTWLNSGTFSPSDEMAAQYGILKAIIARLYLSWIQPFGTGNERSATLVEYHVLIASGMSAAAALQFMLHYARTRDEFDRMLTEAGRPDGKLLPFIRYAVVGFRDGLIELHNRIRTSQANALWEHHIHRLFRDKTSPADLRRRNLAIELSRLARPVSLSNILEEAPRLALEYSSRTHKTLTRDVNDLFALGILKKSSDGVFVSKDRLLRKPE